MESIGKSARNYFKSNTLINRACIIKLCFRNVFNKRKQFLFYSCVNHKVCGNKTSVATDPNEIGKRAFLINEINIFKNVTVHIAHIVIVISNIRTVLILQIPLVICRKCCANVTVKCNVVITTNNAHLTTAHLYRAAFAYAKA